MGFMLVFLTLPLVPWLLYSAYAIATRPIARSLQVQKVAIWFLSVAVVVCVHYLMHSSSRQYAQGAVNAVQAYSEQHGFYPQNLEAIGMTSQQLRSKLSYSTYGIHEGKPYFFYGATYVPFEQENYDFAAREWRHVND